MTTKSRGKMFNIMITVWPDAALERARDINRKVKSAVAGILNVRCTRVGTPIEVREDEYFDLEVHDDNP